MFCLHCNKKFHTCSSCGIRCQEWDYCSDQCWIDDGCPKYCIECEAKTEDVNEDHMCKECVEEDNDRSRN